MLLLIAVLSACAQVPQAPRIEKDAAVASVNVRLLAQQVEAESRHGRLTRPEREALIRRIGEQGSAALVQMHLGAMARFGDVNLHAGNDARLLIDGPATFAAMFASIERARQTIVLESYIIEDADVAQRLAVLLAKKRAEGVRVAVMYDAVGSIGTEEKFFEGLRGNGIAVCAFNPLSPLKQRRYADITHRDHRKILVVDREVGFTGGINISAAYSRSPSGSFGRSRPKALPPGTAAENARGWRDTQIQIRGPASGALDDLFREAWAQQACADPIADPAPRRAVAGTPGAHVLRVVPASPDDKVNRIYELLLTAIDVSQRSVHLTMAYFAPGDDMLEVLCDAALRGVDVQLLLPSKSDFAPVLHAGRSYYERLLAAGVKVHELQDAVLHAKTAVIDGVVSTVGSSNMDWRSFSSNNEVNVVVMGADFGDTMDALFRRDLAASVPIDLVTWRQRPLWQRSAEWLARRFESWW